MKLFKTLAVSAAVALASTSGVTNAGTLQDVQSAGELKCVVTTGVPGFGAPAFEPLAINIQHCLGIRNLQISYHRVAL